LKADKSTVEELGWCEYTRDRLYTVSVESERRRWNCSEKPSCFLPEIFDIVFVVVSDVAVAVDSILGVDIRASVGVVCGKYTVEDISSSPYSPS
jgi:hypothetical protein